MKKSLTFFQIVLATFLGSISSDIIKSYGNQCVSKDRNGCSENRIECVLTNNKNLLVIPSCLIEKRL